MAATPRRMVFPDATALRRGGSRWLLHHGEWFSKMPRPCTVEVHDGCYRSHERELPRDKPIGISTRRSFRNPPDGNRGIVKIQPTR